MALVAILNEQLLHYLQSLEDTFIFCSENVAKVISNQYWLISNQCWLLAGFIELLFLTVEQFSGTRLLLAFDGNCPRHQESLAILNWRIGLLFFSCRIAMYDKSVVSSISMDGYPLYGKRTRNGMKWMVLILLVSIQYPRLLLLSSETFWS